MPELAITTVNRSYTLVRKALNASETWDWFQEYLDLWTSVDADVQAVDDKIDALAALVGDFTADVIKLQAKTGSTEGSVQDYINQFPGAGFLNTPTITDNLDGTVTVGESTCFFSTDNIPESQKAYFTIPEKTLALTIGYPNSLVLDFTVPPYEYEIVLDPTDYLYREDRHVVDFIYYETDGTVRPTNTPACIRSFITRMTRRWIEFAEGRGSFFAERAKGAVLGTTGIRYATLTAGNYWAALRRKESADINTSGADTMTRYYRNGSGGWTKQTGQTQLDNVYYDSGTGTLTAMNTGRFKCVNMYILFDGMGFIELEGQAQYTSLALAEEETRPTNIPPILASFSIYLGRYIVQQGNDVLVVESAFTAEIGVGPVESHNELSNLNVDAQFLHYDSQPHLSESGITVTNENIITGGMDKFEIVAKPIALLRSYTGLLSDFDTYNIVNKDYLFFGHRGTSIIFKIDKNSGQIIDSVVNGAAYRGRIIIDNEIVSFYTQVRVVNIDTFEYRTFPFISGTVDATGGITQNSNGDIFAANVAGNTIYSITYSGNDSYSASVIAPPGIVSVDDIICDDTAYYILDHDTLYYIKKFDIATNTLQATSIAFAVPKFFQIVEGNIHYMTASAYYILSPSLTVLGTMPHTNLGNACNYAYASEGVIYGVHTATFAIDAYAIPSLTEIAPEVVDYRGSRTAIFQDQNSGGFYSEQDFIRTSETVKRLLPERCGVTVLSVETSLPVSPSVGDRYLITAGGAPYENYVVEWTADEVWTVFPRYVGATVFDSDTGNRLTWDGANWGVGFTVHEAPFIAGSTNISSVQHRDTTLLHSATIPTMGSAPVSVVNTDKYIFVGEGPTTDTLRKYDRISGKQISEYTPLTALGRPIAAYADLLYECLANAVLEIPIDAFDSYSLRTATGTQDSLGRDMQAYDRDTLYNVPLDQASYTLQILTRSGSTYNVANYALPGVTSTVYRFTFSVDKNFFYILDGNVVRKYNLSRVLQLSSTPLTGALGNNTTMRERTDGLLEVLYGNRVLLLNTGTMAVVYDGTTTVTTGSAGTFLDGEFLQFTATTFEKYQLPGLIEISEAFTEHSGNGVMSSPDVFDSSQVPIQIRDADVVRSVLHTQSLLKDQTGVTVLSVETSIPGSPIIGATYLISGGTSMYEGYIIRWTAQEEWEPFGKNEGGIAHDAATGDQYQLRSGTWEKIGLLTEANHGYLTGGASTSVPHAHRPTIRTITATNEVELTDEQNVILVSDARTASVALTIDAAVLAIDGFEFSVLAEYDVANDVDLYAPTGTSIWRMNGDAGSGRPLAYRFIVEGGIPHPFGTMPTFISA